MFMIRFSSSDMLAADGHDNPPVTFGPFPEAMLEGYVLLVLCDRRRPMLLAVLDGDFWIVNADPAIPGAAPHRGAVYDRIRLYAASPVNGDSP
jgi:hypothetical protein